MAKRMANSAMAALDALPVLMSPMN